MLKINDEMHNSDITIKQNVYNYEGMIKNTRNIKKHMTDIFIQINIWPNQQKTDLLYGIYIYISNH